MALTAAEEETLESLKAWWNENGKRLVAILLVIAGGYTGWLFWQNQQAATASAASDQYEMILSLTLVDPGSSVSEEDGRRIIDLAAQLREEHTNSDYARFASLFAAQQQVRLDDLEGAEATLRWIVENPREGLLREEDAGLQLTATLRLGRVLLAQAQHEQALGLVNSVDPQSFEAGFAELRGDIYLAMGRPTDAYDAYVAAQQAGSTSPNLQLKLNSLAPES